MQPTPEQLASLQRLWKIANGGTGQCRYVAQFLLGLYNGPRFPFDMTNFRPLDTEIFMDCLSVLEMDNRPDQEIHLLLGVSSSVFEQLAKDWAIFGYRELKSAPNAVI